MKTGIAIKLDEDESVKPVKKNYHSPQLVTYGNISEVTRMVNPTGNKNDNGPQTGKDKT